MANETQTHPNARKGPDIIIKLIDLSSIILWGILLLSIGFIISAKPQSMTLFDHLFKTTVREYWDFRLLQSALIISLVQFCLSLFSLYLNSKRLKRKTDRIRISIVISTFASLIICVSLAFILR